MGSLSIWHWLIVLAVVLVLFGGGSKISSLMGDFGKGLKSFKKNIAEDEPAQPPAVPDASFNAPPQQTASQDQYQGQYKGQSGYADTREPVRHG